MQAPSWSEYLQCPICQRSFSSLRPPTSLLCGHTLCVPCTTHLQRGVCPFDGVSLENIVTGSPVNFSLLKLAEKVKDPSLPSAEAAVGLANDREGAETEKRTVGEIQRSQSDALAEEIQDSDCVSMYSKACCHLDGIADFLMPVEASVVGSSGTAVKDAVPRLSRPLHKKLAALVQCQLLHGNGRSRFMRYAKSIGERSCTELLLLHQNQSSLVHDLWSAVRKCGGQFLGPVLQEQVLNAVYNVMSKRPRPFFQRKTLVEFVMHILARENPAVSKTNIGHVIHLMYRGSCFQIRKDKSEQVSQLSLHESIQTQSDFRREHDIQLARIAMERGLHITPEYFSHLLYGTSMKRAHMQSIMDKLTTPEYHAHSVEELVIMAQKTGNAEAVTLLRPKFMTIQDVTRRKGDIALADVCNVLEAVVRILSTLVAHPKFEAWIGGQSRKAATANSSKSHGGSSSRTTSETVDSSVFSRGSVASLGSVRSKDNSYTVPAMIGSAAYKGSSNSSSFDSEAGQFSAAPSQSLSTERVPTEYDSSIVSRGTGHHTTLPQATAAVANAQGMQQSHHFVHLDQMQPGNPRNGVDAGTAPHLHSRGAGMYQASFHDGNAAPTAATVNPEYMALGHGQCQCAGYYHSVPSGMLWPGSQSSDAGFSNFYPAPSPLQGHQAECAQGAPQTGYAEGQHAIHGLAWAQSQQQQPHGTLHPQANTVQMRYHNTGDNYSARLPSSDQGSSQPQYAGLPVWQQNTMAGHAHQTHHHAQVATAQNMAGRGLIAPSSHMLPNATGGSDLAVNFTPFQ